MKMLKEIRKFLRKFKNEFGYTLMEVAAVVAITATLTAVVVPIAKDQIDNAKKQAAIGDCQNIAVAIGNFMKDTGRPPFYIDGTTAGLPQYDPLKVYAVLATAIGDEAAASGNTNWTATNALGIFLGTADTLENQLILNKPGGTNGAYNTGTDFSWKGPYSAAFKTDPWGNKYYVNIQHAAQSDVNVIWVLSAGPDQEIGTDFSQAATSGAILGGDDIGIRVK